MATTGTCCSVNKLQEAGASEPLAVATVEVAEGAASRPVGADYMRAEVHRAFVIHTGILAGMMVAIAGLAVTVAKLI